MWLAIVRVGEREGPRRGRVGGRTRADLVEVRPETVVFQVAATDEGRVRAALDARGVELAAVCSRCGWGEDGAAGNAWADAARSVCQRCHDAVSLWEGLR